MHAGVAPGDDIVAINHIKATADLPGRIAKMNPGQEVVLHVFRRDELQTLTATLQSAPCDTVVLTLEKEAGDSALEVLDNWLGAAD